MHRCNLRIIIYCALAAFLLIPVICAAQPEQQRADGNLFSGSGRALCDFESLWKYHVGDSAHFSEPDYDDSHWSIKNPGFAAANIEEYDWQGIGWFRFHLTLDSSQFGKVCGLFMRQAGSSEIYLNGELATKFGEIGTDSETTVPHIAVVPSRYYFTLPDQVENVVAVRFANFDPDRLQIWGGYSGFQMVVSYAGEGTDFYINETLIGAHYQNFLTGFCLAIALLHLFLYLFYPRYIGNLYYTIFTLSCAGLAFFPGEQGIANSPGAYFAYTYLFKLSLIVAAVFGPLVLYTAFYTSLPRVFWYLAGAGIIMTGASGFLSLEAVYIFLYLGLFESVRVTVLSVYRRKQGARLIGAGYLAFVIGGGIQMLEAFEMFNDIAPKDTPVYMWGILGLLIATSIYLARTFASMNKNLISQLDQVNRLSDKTIEQAQLAHEQELKQKLLEKEIAHNRSELEKAAELEKALAEIESAHSKLQQADDRLRVIIDTSPVPLIVSRISDGTILYANKHLGLLVGHAVDDLEGRMSPDFYYDPNDRTEVVKLLERDGLIDNHEVRIKHREGNIIWCLFSMVASEIGGDKVIIGGLYDISERKKAEERLKLYRRIFDNSQDGIMVFDTEGNLILRNPAHRELSGVKDKDAEGKTVLELLPESAREAIQEGLQKGKAFRGEFEWPPVDGRARPIDLSVFTIPDVEGNVVYSVGMGRDVSERRAAQRAMQETMRQLQSANDELKETQTQLIQSEKMASLGTLVAGIAHEINTPIGAISSMHDTLIRAIDKLKTATHEHASLSDEDVARVQPLLDTIDQANKVIKSGTDRVTTIVKRLRSFVRLDEAELKKADINEGLEDTLTMIHHQIKGRITVKRNYGEVGEIACYPGRLNQVFLNLLNNAQQAIEGKGVIDVTTLVENDRLVISIADNGSGIPAEHMNKIFDPGFTSKGVGVGTGLGLSICYKIIQEHRGEITVTSEAGKGTTFTVKIPTDLDTRIGIS